MSGDGDAKADIKSRIASAPWARISLQLTRYAFVCIKNRSWHDAEEYSQDAITDLIDPKTRTWDPATEPDLFKHLAKLVRGKVTAERMRRHRRRNHSYFEYEEPDAVEKAEAEDNLMTARAMAPPAYASFAPRQDALLDVRETQEKELTRVREHFAKDQKVLKVLEMVENRIDGMQAQADHSGMTFDEVRSARRRLERFVEKMHQEPKAGSGEAS
jgi:hypothetical protein